MKKYIVNVHYDAVVTVEVEAESEEKALELAPIKAESISLEDADVVDINSCVTDIEDIPSTTEITYHGESYKCRILIDNEGNELIIASTQLLDKLMPYVMTDTCSGYADKEAEHVDNKIFYYVDSSDLSLDDSHLKEIVKEANPDWFD